MRKSVEKEREKESLMLNEYQNFLKKDKRLTERKKEKRKKGRKKAGKTEKKKARKGIIKRNQQFLSFLLSYWQCTKLIYVYKIITYILLILKNGSMLGMNKGSLNNVSRIMITKL